jgi:uncharacterized protein YqhQ
MISNQKSSKDEVLVGGQAVIEGVMMRGKDAVSVAVRKPNNEIALKVEQKPRWTSTNFLFGLPFIRGVITLAETLVLGINTLTYSANQAGVEEEKLSKAEMGFSLFLSVLLSIGLFIALPAFVFTRLKAAPVNTITLNLIEGLIRISIFIGFLSAINLMPDMRRVFEYHGAEHKVIHAYDDRKSENGFSVDSLTPAAVKAYSPIHASCGTSFLLMVLMISILVFSFLGRPSFLMRVAMKLSLLPVIAGISYEIIRLARKKNAFFLFKILVLPGMLLQKLTTREPDPSQIEVAIQALKPVI